MAEIAIVQRQVDAGGSDCRPASATSKRPARVYLPWRLSDAGAQHRRIGHGGPASETLYNFTNSVDAPDLGPDAQITSPHLPRYCAVSPPSTTRPAPVMKAASSEARGQLPRGVDIVAAAIAVAGGEGTRAMAYW
jgi:hypothetical protein